MSIERLAQQEQRSLRFTAGLTLGGTALTALLFLLLRSPILGAAAIGGLLLTIFVVIWLWQAPMRGVYVLFGGAVLLAPYVEPGLTDYIGWYLPFFEDIKSWTHVGIVVSIAELLMVLVLVIWLLKGIAERNFHFDRGSLMRPLGLYMLMVLVGEARGLGSGGSFHDSLWELRSQVYMLVAYILVCNLLKNRSQLTKLLWILLILAGLRGIEGTFQYFFVLRAIGESTHELYPHEQSYFFNGFLTLTIIIFLYGGSRRMKKTALWLLPFVLIGDMANNRRASIAALVISMIVLGVFTWIVQPRTRRVIVRVLIFLAIVYPPYFLHYQNQTGFLALPARAISSSFHPTANDAASNQYRIFEDLDIMTTVKSSSISALIGYGFGKPMMSPYWLPNIGYVFQYLMPHNSILWIWMRLGTIGYILFWLLIGTAVIQLTRLVLRLRDRYFQGLALFVLLMLVQQVIISYVDLQWSNYRTMIMTGVLFALISRIPALATAEIGQDRRGLRSMGVLQSATPVLALVAPLRSRDAVRNDSGRFTADQEAPAIQWGNDTVSEGHVPVLPWNDSASGYAREGHRTTMQPRLSELQDVTHWVSAQRVGSRHADASLEPHGETEITAERIGFETGQSRMDPPDESEIAAERIRFENGDAGLEPRDEAYPWPEDLTT